MVTKEAIDRDLKSIARNIKVFTGKDDATKNVLTQMGLKFSDVSDVTRRQVEEAAVLLSAVDRDAAERISSARKIVQKLNEDKEVPTTIKKMILSTALNRLSDAESSFREKAVSEKYSLELFLSDDKKIQQKLKKMGIEEVPELVKKVAMEAQVVLNDKTLNEKERAIKAADVLMEPLQPAITGDRERKALMLQNEIKSILWEIANDLTYEAAKA